MLSNKLRKWILQWLFGHENMDYLTDALSLASRYDKLSSDLLRDYKELGQEHFAILEAVSTAPDLETFQLKAIAILDDSLRRIKERKANEIKEESSVV